MLQKKSIVVSACLLGHKVRYDGAHQKNEMIKQLVECFNIISICPEVEIGLGVPRNKIALHQRGEKIHLLTCSQPVTDLTEQMIAYTYSFINSHEFSGMILKDKSPSCGVENCKQHDESGSIMHRNGTGVFAATIIQLMPDLPMLQSDLVSQPSALHSFMRQVYEY